MWELKRAVAEEEVKQGSDFFSKLLVISTPQGSYPLFSEYFRVGTMIPWTLLLNIYIKTMELGQQGQ